MRSCSRKSKFLIGILVTAFVVLYLEFLSYVINFGSWATLPDHFINGKKAEPVRILVVADPQLIGERDEHPLLGIVTRWDSDRYLRRTFSLAKYHVQPDAILYLGDLFDEGSIATYEEYQRYFARFSAVFDLPDRTGVSHIFIPGDNDVGGESTEPVSKEKLRWFSRFFGNLTEATLIQRPTWNLQFVKYNRFLPAYASNSLHGLDNVLTSPNPTFRIVISHFSVLNFITESTQTAMRKLQPSLILGAHDHISLLYRLRNGPNNSLHTSLRRNFLSPSSTNVVISSDGSSYEASDSIYQYYKFNAEEAKKDQSIHEVDVPTCSYRMGVKEMGFGELHLYEDGEVFYTVLWSPSRFRQLYVYLFLYILSKIIFTPWFAYKAVKFTWERYKRYRLNHSGQYGAKGKWGSFEKANGARIP